jgi:hypothetical protein
VYKDYANITHLFHFACKAEREVQGHHASAKTNFSTGRTNSWQRNNGRTTQASPSPSQVAPSTSNNSSKHRPAVTNSATRVPSATKTTPRPAESAASSSRARDIQCHCCKGFGHVMRDCSSKHVLVIRDDGEYLPLVISVRIHSLCLQLTMQVMTITLRSILEPVM